MSCFDLRSHNIELFFNSIPHHKIKCIQHTNCNLEIVKYVTKLICLCFTVQCIIIIIIIKKNRILFNV